MKDFLQSLQSGRVKVVDLTQLLHEETPIIHLPEPFANSPGFEMHAVSHYDEKGPAWYWNWFKMGEHTGTHIDAPRHWITGKAREGVEEIPPAHLVAPAVVIDVEKKVASDPDYLLRKADIEDWEGVHGRIPEKCWVLMRTGWSRFGNDPEKFLNVAGDGRPHWPGFSEESATFFTHDRPVLGVGTEAVGTDAGSAAGHDPPFPNHSIMHGGGRYGLTSLVNLDQLPPVGSLLIAAPLKIRGGSGSPARVLALVPA